MNTPNVKSKTGAVIRVASGNFLEMYDFMVFGYYSAAIAHAFFPAESEFSSLMLSLMTFGAGFLMRPLGAIFLGAYIDHHGRRRGLLVTLGLMSVGTLLLACVPDYRAVGLIAPILVVIGRLLQGFSAGVELGGVSVYLAEISPPGKKGFFVAWQSASQQVAVIFAAFIGVLLNKWLPPDQVLAWGWRIPLGVGCLIVPFLFFLRRSLEETESFAKQKHRPTPKEIYAMLVSNWRIVLTGVMLVTMTTTSFYFITAYTPTFGTKALNLSSADALFVTFCVGLSNLFWLPVMGSLSDYVGRRPLLYVASALALFTAYPVLAWLVSAPSFGRLLGVELWFSLLFGTYNGAMVVYLTELMPPQVRTSGFSVAYSLATAIFGGFTPAVCTALIHATENRAIPGLWMAFAALCGFTATWIAGKFSTEKTGSSLA